MRENWKQLSESVQKRLDFLFMKKLLEIDPTSYSVGHHSLSGALLTIIRTTKACI